MAFQPLNSFLLFTNPPISAQLFETLNTAIKAKLSPNQSLLAVGTVNLNAIFLYDIDQSYSNVFLNNLTFTDTSNF